MADWTTGSQRRDRSEQSLQVALSELEAARRRRRYRLGWVFFGLLTLTAVAASLVFVPRPDSRALGGLTAGQEATVNIASVVGVDEDAWIEVARLESADAQTELNLFLGTGRAFVVSEGTRVVVVETDFTIVMVRSLEGPNSGKAGWMRAASLVVN